MNITEDAPIEVTVYRSRIDGALVVEIDTVPGTGRVRVNLNDGTLWDSDPEVPRPRSDAHVEALSILRTMQLDANPAPTYVRAARVDLRKVRDALDLHAEGVAGAPRVEGNAIMASLANALDDRGNTAAAEWLRNNADDDALYEYVGKLLNTFERFADDEK